MFSMGFIEDVKLNFKPIYRLILMIIILLIFTIYFSINITSIDLNFLNSWLKNDIFSIIFVLLCFLFIVNGSNLIDGFNGLLAIHILIINIILYSFHGGKVKSKWTIVGSFWKTDSRRDKVWTFQDHCKELQDWHCTFLENQNKQKSRDLQQSQSFCVRVSVFRYVSLDSSKLWSFTFIMSSSGPQFGTSLTSGTILNVTRNSFLRKNRTTLNE